MRKFIDMFMSDRMKYIRNLATYINKAFKENK